MNFKKKIIGYLFLTITVNLLYNCSDNDCTKMINIPKYDPNNMTFVDNFQEVPCDLEEPVTEPVN